ncbi:MAG: hypothetical protein ACOCT9_02295 [archaeon]
MISEKNFYDWQHEIINYQGDIYIRGGRQTGKSWAVAARAIKFAMNFPGSTQLLIAPGGRQEGYIREKIIYLLGDKYKFRRRQIKEWLPLHNKSDIFIYPVGQSGVFVEGLSSVDHLIVEEAGHLSEEVIDAIMPMLLEPKKRGLGWITALGNTRKCKLHGFFYKAFKDKNNKTIHVRAEDQPHADINFLKKEKKRLGKRMYNVIYGGEFDEYAFRYFPKEIIKKCVKIKKWKLEDYDNSSKYFLGIDPARYGKSEAAFVVSEIPQNKKKIRIIHTETLKKSSLKDLRDKCIELDKFFRFKKIFPDDGGVGAGLVDILEEEFKKRLKPLNNRAKSKEGFRISKEDYYSNLLKLLENEEIELIQDKKLIEGLSNVEVDENEGTIIIKGTDIAEAAIRAAWAWKEKSLKLFAA